MRSVPAALVGLALLIFSVAAATTVGPADLSVSEVWRIVGHHLGLGGEPSTRIRDAIVWELRLPRVLLAAVVGAGLALCGAVLQSLTRNPLADPYLLGVSSGASTGAVCVLLLGVGAGVASLSAGAFVGALIAFSAVLALAGRRFERVVLAGVAGTQLFSALTSFVVLWAGDAQATRGVLYWLLGSFSAATWSDVGLGTAVVLLGGLVCLRAADALDAFAFGADAAQTLGVDVVRLRLALLVVTAVLTAALVATSGAIGFIGLVIPHAARMLVGPRHRRLLPAAAIGGAIFTIWVDALARTAFAPRELPVGVLTALVGVPAFAVLLRRTGGFAR